jgi:hypothetical protein
MTAQSSPSRGHAAMATSAQRFLLFYLLSLVPDDLKAEVEIRQEVQARF